MFSVFCTTQNLECLPFGGGWAEQPYWITQALETLKVEKWQVDEEEREQRKQIAGEKGKYGRR